MRKQDKIGQFHVGYEMVPDWLMDYVRKGHARLIPPGPIATQCVEVNRHAQFHRGEVLSRKMFNRHIKGHPAYAPMCNQ
jgi:hypothetical protein